MALEARRRNAIAFTREAKDAVTSEDEPKGEEEEEEEERDDDDDDDAAEEERRGRGENK